MKTKYSDREKYRLGRILKSDVRKIASTRILTRILIYLNEVGFATQTQIKDAIGTSGYIVQDGLLWLMNHGFVEKFNLKANKNLYRLKKKVN